MFWTAVKPFLTNKESSKDQGITLEVGDDQLDDKIKVAEELNEYFANIVEITTGKKLIKHSYNETGIVNEQIIHEIIDKYKNHESIKQIRSNYDANKLIFSFKPSTSEDIRKIIHDLRAKTSIGFDNVPPKLLKTESDIISKPLSNLINETMIKCSHFPNTEKIACIEIRTWGIWCSFRPLLHHTSSAHSSHSAPEPLSLSNCIRSWGKASSGTIWFKYMVLTFTLVSCITTTKSKQ